MIQINDFAIGFHAGSGTSALPIQLDFDVPVLKSVDLPALVLSIASATAIFRFKLGMLTVLVGSCAS